ncbi:MAG: acyl-CoA dehydratase activase [Candidatus Omnitrophica bacterium]|nr:acyl-CoA dehydratase activase [Candidatus Omnitrophota bacterium]
MRSFGIDIGTVTLKAVWLEENQVIKVFWQVHQGEIQRIWQQLKEDWQIKDSERVVITGYYRQLIPFFSIPERIAQEQAIKFLFPNREISILRLGGSGFSVLNLRGEKKQWLLNPRCAAGTGIFLDQILSRLNLKVYEIDELVKGIRGLEITSRCGVTMKTDFTHLLNQGNNQKEVVAGLLDALAKNAVALLVKSSVCEKVVTIGGLSTCKRIVQTIQSLLDNSRVETCPQSLYFEALGAALIAINTESVLSQVKTHVQSHLVFLPGLKDSIKDVTKFESPKIQTDSVKDLVAGFDIGSTGSKIVIFGQFPIFEAYIETKGDPIGAAKNLIKKVPEDLLKRIKGVGVTGSGREILGPLLKATLRDNQDQIFILNEIAAHAQGAVFYDAEVDTVVDIGGQDSKFIRLENGVVVDQAMNTVCSAGTGSFLAEQIQLLGISDIKEFGKLALESARAVDLGQHCAIFISEQIDAAQQEMAKIEEIVAGLYYSIVRNYNNRVKGQRDYGKKIFLQGKPAENIALACALARISGKKIIVPPSPGTMGALGISILAKKEIGDLAKKPVLNFETFLKTQVVSKREFKCQSKENCKIGNRCTIDLIETEVNGEKIKFFWGGRCDKYEKYSKKNLVLVSAPQPFLERERLIQKLLDNNFSNARNTVGIPRGLEIEEILPLVIKFFQETGFNVKILRGKSLDLIEKGAKLCQVSFCAPLQVLAGQAKELEAQDFLFLPKVIEIKAEKGEKRCYVCPLSQAVPDMFSPFLPCKILNPFLNFKSGYRRALWEFILMGKKAGITPWRSYIAFKKAVKTQEEFEKKLKEIGRKAIEFANKNRIPVIVVLGHPYIINSALINGKIPEIIDEKGGIALPAECYPLEGRSPQLDNIYWGYGHRLLDVAYQVRRKQNVFPLWLSVYSCGPDSFLTHFFQYLSSGKPYCLLESDAYTGEAGFKTRIEAFLYSVKNYKPEEKEKLSDLSAFEIKEEILQQVEGRKVLVPWMGEGSILLPALLKSFSGVEAEWLPIADESALELGRRFTLGKECLPVIVTLGSLLKYLKEHPGEEKYAYFMPKAEGPCRFGQYQIFVKMVMEKLGLSEKVIVVSPTPETGYHLGKKLKSSMQAKSWATFVLVDLLKDALHQIRPVEKKSGQAEELFNHCLKLAEDMILKGKNDWTGYKNLWGMEELARFAANEFKQIPVFQEKRPKILVTGEIYVRLDAFSNNHVIRKLESLGATVKLAPFREWVNYALWWRRKGLTVTKQNRVKTYLTWLVQRRIEERLYRIFARELGWHEDHSVDQILNAARDYLSYLRPLGEAALTIGLPLLLWKKKEIDGAVLVGPFECMPTRIAETQLRLVSEKTGLPIISLSFHGDPLNTDPLEVFVWELKNK